MLRGVKRGYYLLIKRNDQYIMVSLRMLTVKKDGQEGHSTLLGDMPKSGQETSCSCDTSVQLTPYARILLKVIRNNIRQ
jgi:hypothetical protein